MNKIRVLILIAIIMLNLLKVDCYAGVDFTGGHRDSAQLVPQFKNTEEALAFGKQHKGDREIKYLLQLKRREALVKAYEMLDKATNLESIYIQQCIDWNVRAQLYREAIEALDGKDYAMVGPPDFKNRTEVFSFVDKYKTDKSALDALVDKQEKLMKEWQEMLLKLPLSDNNKVRVKQIDDQISYILLALKFMEPVGGVFKGQSIPIGKPYRGQIINGTTYYFIHN